MKKKKNTTQQVLSTWVKINACDKVLPSGYQMLSKLVVIISLKRRN